MAKGTVEGKIVKPGSLGVGFSLCCSCVLPLLLVCLIPPLAHQVLPVYPKVLEANIASLYDAIDEVKLVDYFFTDYVHLDQSYLDFFLPSTENGAILAAIPGMERLVDSFRMINRAGHFGKLLKNYQKAFPHRFDNDVKDQFVGSFFEGWYYKFVSKDQLTTIISIPAVYFDGNTMSKTKSHGFIMSGLVQRNKAGKVIHHNISYSKFDLNEINLVNFNHNDSFKLYFGNHAYYDDANEMKINVPGVIKGHVKLTKVKPYIGSWINPSVVGFIGYLDHVIGMQCVHKVLAVDAVLEGKLSLHLPEGETEVDLTGGKGYVEGDYGHEFPDKYIWIASNHFPSKPGSSVLLSLASIPVPNKKYMVAEFPGFLGFIYDADKDKTYRFGTPTGASISVEGDKFNKNLLKNASSVAVEVRDAQYIYSISVVGTREKSIGLWGPKVNAEGHFEMIQYVDEMLDAQVQVIVRRRSDQKIVFEGLGLHGGLEIQFP